MEYRQTTQVPNELFDIHLLNLTFSEIKILLYIIRQTYGWISKNGKRKQRDRITHGQFSNKTGLSRRIITESVQSLIIKHLIKVTDYYGNFLHEPKQRKGKVGIYYAPCVHRSANNSTKVCNPKHKPMQNRVFNKTNNTKLNRQKDFGTVVNRVSDWDRIQEILNNRNR
jgi:hypothetical protein